MARPSTSLRITTLQTRPPLQRMMQIFNAIKNQKYPNRIRLAEVTESAVKTVQRDIDFMRDRLRIPIEYNREGGGYFFTEPVHNFPMMELTEAELISVFVAQKALNQYQNTPFEQPLRSAFQKLVSGLEGTIALSWEELDSFVSFRSPETVVPAAATTFQVVSEAVRLNKLLHFQYKKLDAADYETRTVEPYQLVCYRGQWYCFGHDLAREAMRTFVLARMRGAELGVEEFVRPQNFSLQEHLKNSFGVFSGSGQKLHRVVLRFNSATAQLIRERVWHESQTIQELAEGELELTLSVNSLFEIESWVLSWGDQVTVLRPKELINRCREVAKNLVERYS